MCVCHYRWQRPPLEPGRDVDDSLAEPADMLIEYFRYWKHVSVEPVACEQDSDCKDNMVCKLTSDLATLLTDDVTVFLKEHKASRVCMLASTSGPSTAEASKFDRYPGHTCKATHQFHQFVLPGKGTDHETNHFGDPKTGTNEPYVWPKKFTDMTMDTEEKCRAACADPEMPFVCTAYQFTAYSADKKHCTFTNSPLEGKYALQRKEQSGADKNDVCGVISES